MLSDELLAIGRKANPKSNYSQGEQCKIMWSLLNENANKSTRGQLMNITKFVVAQLNKEGYPFYKFDIFWKTKKL